MYSCTLLLLVRQIGKFGKVEGRGGVVRANSAKVDLAEATRWAACSLALRHRTLSDISGGEAMGDRVWQVPQEQFVEAWNGGGSLAKVVERVKELAGGNVPKWAVMARATALRKGGVEMQSLPAARTPEQGQCAEAVAE